jgi:hypothetical protein
MVIVFSMALQPRAAANREDNALDKVPFLFRNPEAPVLTEL